MKTYKKVLLTTLISTMLCATGYALSNIQFPESCLTSVSAATLSNKATRYEYALLGETYAVQEGFQGGKTPRGKEISAETKEVFLDWASGVYLFNYEHYDVNLRVYEQAPQDSIEYLTELASMVAGVTYELPSAEIISGINRTDGAPKLDNYDYQLTISDETGIIETFKSSAIPSFAFPIGGTYTIAYNYENIFGESKSFARTVEVADEKIIIDDLQKSYFFGSELDLGEIYGLYLGEKYEVAFSCTSPSGEVYEDVDKLFLDEVGVWNLEAICDFGSETPVVKAWNIEVELGVASFVAGLKSAEVNGTIPVTESFYSDERSAVLLSPVGSGISVSYNGVVDLREMGMQDALVSFLPNITTGDGISSASVTLTDVYNPFNTLKISYTRNGSRTDKGGFDNVIMTVSYGTITTGTSNYTALSDQAVAWNYTFYTYWLSAEFTGISEKSRYPFTVSYVMDTNKVYAYGNFDVIDASTGAKLKVQQNQWCEVADLSASRLAQKFEGFTTGEVYVRIDTIGYGDLGIITLGGKSASTLTIDDYSATSDILIGDADLSIVGVVGKEYPLPEAQRSSYLKNDIYRSLFDPNGNEIALTANYFVPEQAGVYTLKYTTTNAFGIEVEKNYEITIAEEATPITILYQKPSELKAGEIYQVKEPIITGGNGVVTYIIKCNGVEVQPGSFIKIGATFKLTIDATDSFGFTKSRTFTTTVDKDVIEAKCDFPKSAVCGSNFVIPTAEIYSYLLGKNVDTYEIYVDDVLTEATELILPARPCEVKFEYKTEYGSAIYTLKVIKDVTATTKIEEFLDFEGTGGIFEIGSEVTVAGNSKISFPYKVSTSGLNLEFVIKEEDLTYDKVTFILTAQDGTQVTIGLDGLKSGKPEIILNGIATGKMLDGTIGVGNDIWKPEYSAKTYYAYKLKYEDCYRYIMSGNKPIIEVSQALSGLAFDGFGGGVYVSAVLEELTEATATICLTKISNQTLAESGFSEGDMVAPEIYSDGCANNKIVTKGFVLDLSSIKAFDAMSNGATALVTITAPNRQALVKEVAPETVVDLVLDEYGTYKINILIEDSAGNFANKSYSYTVRDDIAPILTVVGVQDIETQLGEVVKFFDATVQDNVTEGCTVSLFIRNPLGQVECIVEDADAISNVEYTALISGTYSVWYQAIDASGNVTMVRFSLTVR